MSAKPDWSRIDTVMLDMDGTLLDLCYDNHLWNQVLPQWVARARHGDGPLTQAQQQAINADLLGHMREIYGTMDFYSLDYWHAHTKLDLIAMHREFDHMIHYRPSAEAFLERLAGLGKTRVLATNAHRGSLDVKHARSGINDRVDRVFSSHDFGCPKEDAGFWHAMQQNCPFDPERTLFIDDNERVLDCAREHGIAQLLIVTQPDSARPARVGLGYPGFNDFAEIMPAAGT